MKTTTTSQAQIDRTNHRGNDGKFIKNPCDCCGKGCPMDYYSDPRCNVTGGFGLTLHARCAAKLETLTDAEYAAFAAFVAGINSAW